MEFIIEFPVANAVKFTRDDRNTDRRASFDQQRFADAVHMGMMERDFYQPFEQQDPLRPQFYTNFPISKLSVIDCFTWNTVASYNPTIAKQFTRKYYRADAKFVSVGGKLFIYFDTGNEYSDRSEEHTSELQSRENLVCRLLLEKKKKKKNDKRTQTINRKINMKIIRKDI